MRILSVSEKWDKLKQPEWTTFRFMRRDRDWEVNEMVQVVFKSRTAQREDLGVAIIEAKEPRWIFSPGAPEVMPGAVGYTLPSEVTEAEAIADGFKSVYHLQNWMIKAHKARPFKEQMNKLTLKWVERRF